MTNDRDKSPFSSKEVLSLSSRGELIASHPSQRGFSRIETKKAPVVGTAIPSPASPVSTSGTIILSSVKKDEMRANLSALVKAETILSPKGEKVIGGGDSHGLSPSNAKVGKLDLPPHAGLCADRRRMGGGFVEVIPPSSGPHITTCSIHPDHQLLSVAPISANTRAKPMGGAGISIAPRRPLSQDGTKVEVLHPATEGNTILSSDEKKVSGTRMETLRPPSGKAMAATGIKIKTMTPPSGEVIVVQGAKLKSQEEQSLRTSGGIKVEQIPAPNPGTSGGVKVEQIPAPTPGTYGGIKVERLADLTPKEAAAKRFKVERLAVLTTGEAKKRGLEIERLVPPSVEAARAARADVFNIETMKEPTEEDAKARGFKIETPRAPTEKVAYVKGVRMETCGTGQTIVQNLSPRALEEIARSDHELKRSRQQHSEVDPSRPRRCLGSRRDAAWPGSNLPPPDWDPGPLAEISGDLPFKIVQLSEGIILVRVPGTRTWRLCSNSSH